MNKEELFYVMHSERQTISLCLEQVGKTLLAKNALYSTTSPAVLNFFVKIIKKEAYAQERHDILEQLFFAGLILTY